MQVYELKEFFEKIGYNWLNDMDRIEEICRLTKTRYKENPPKGFLDYGCEQPFFLKAVAEYATSKKVLEIGTGRGTGAYSMALADCVEMITTLDIVPFTQKQHTAIGYENAFASNSDLNYLIPYPEKSKIEFRLAPGFEREVEYDLAFIDGDHTNESVVRNDFEMCKHVLDNGGIIIWDDYGQSEFVVKQIVDSIPDVNTILVEFRGHLFSDKEPEKMIGDVIMTKHNFFEE